MSLSEKGMLGRDAARRLLEGVLLRSRATQMEATLTYRRTALTRFAANYIHQNVSDDTPTLTVRAVVGTRSGTATTTRLDDAAIAHTVQQATAMAQLAPEKPDFRGLPGPAGEPGEAPYSTDTAHCPPEVRAEAAGTICRLAREAGLGASGRVTTIGEEVAVANSLGVFAYTPRSEARAVMVVTGEDGSGYAEDNALDIAQLDVAAAARRAVAIALRAQHPVLTPPGDYTAILQPEAVADMLSFLCRLGFAAQPVDEGRSFVAGRRGERLLGENVTIWDDGQDPTGFPAPFDAEGMPRRRLTLVERGVVEDIALDSFYAGRMGTQTNGHAVPVATDFYTGPLPANPFLAPGTATVEELVRSTARGLLVTRFNYTRVVHPLHLIVTGMTRDGTFLIENGEVTRPVKNLRYTQSYRDALCAVEALSRETRLVSDIGVVARVPALKIGRFAFTGVTE